MSQDKCNPRFQAGSMIVTILVCLMVVSAIVYMLLNGCVPAPTPSAKPKPEPTAAPRPQLDAEIWCTEAKVWAGQESQNPMPLIEPCAPLVPSQLGTLYQGDIVVTDDTGEALLRHGACDIYVFSLSNYLTMRLCPKGTTNCSEGALYVADCDAFQMQTLSGDINLESTALIIYLSEYQLTLVAVLEGHGWLHPVAEIEGRRMTDKPVEIPAGRFAYTVPDDRIDEIRETVAQAGVVLGGRTSHSIADIGLLVDVFDLHPWLARGREIAKEQDIRWPSGRSFSLRMGNLYPNDKLISEAIIMGVPWQEVLDQLEPDTDVPFLVEHGDASLGDIRGAPYDPDQARALVRQALSTQDDVAPRDTISLMLLVPNDDKQVTQMAQIMQEHLVAVGIDLEIAGGGSTSDLAVKTEAMMAEGTLDLVLTRR